MRQWVLYGLLGSGLVLVSCGLWSSTESDGRGGDVATVTCLHPGEGAYQSFCELFRDFYSRYGDPKFQIDVSSTVTAPGSQAEALSSDRDEANGSSRQISGSMDILDAIARDETLYLGLAQNDVAYHFRFGRHPLIPSPHPQNGKVVALARVLPEYLHVHFTAGKPEKEAGPGTGGDPSFDSVRTQVDALAVGVLGSGTLVTSMSVLPTLFGSAITGSNDQAPRLLRQPPLPPPPGQANSPEEDPGRVEPKTSLGRVFVAGLGHAPFLVHLARHPRGVLASLDEAERRYIRGAFAHVYSTRRVDPYRDEGTGEGPRVEMVEVSALLVASRRLPGPVARSVREFFARIDAQAEDGNAEADRSASDADESWPDPARIARSGQLLEQMRVYTSSRYRDLILQEHRETLPWPWKSQLLELFIAALAVCVGLWLLRLALRQLKTERDIFKVSALITGGIAVCICIAWLHLILFLVTWLENAFYRSYATDSMSAFVGGSYPSLLPMVLHYIASAFSAEKLFPVNNTAQFLWLSIPLLIGASTFAGLVHVSLPPALNYLKKNLEGGTEMQLSNHVVVCNWHPYLPDIVRQLHEQEAMEGDDSLQVVLLAKDLSRVKLPRLGTQRDQTIGEHDLFAVPPGDRHAGAERLHQVVALEGDPSCEALLSLADVRQAFAVIVFPDDTCPDPDGPTAMTVLTIDRLRGVDCQAKLIVWCAQPSNVANFLDPRFRINDVCSTEWAWRVVCQATRVGHVSNVYRSLMTASEESNEFYEIQLPEDFCGATFAELQARMIEYSRAGCQPIQKTLSKRNTLLLVGFFSRPDVHREEPYLNPEPETEISPGDTLLFLTYRFDCSIKDRLLSFLCEPRGGRFAAAESTQAS